MIYHIKNYKRVIKLSWSVLLFNKTHPDRLLSLIVSVFCVLILNIKYKIVGKGWVKHTFVFLNKYKVC